MGCGGSKSTGAQPAGSRTPRRANQKGKKGGSSGGKGGNKSGQNSKVPVNEKGYKKRIRENLRQAAAGNDIEELERNMEIFVNNRMEDGGDYTEAEDRLDFLLTRKDIRDACMRNHPVVLDRAIQRVEASPHKRKLKSYLDRAYYLKQHQNELETYRHDISDLDQACVSEVKSYHHPPPPVHTTMVATYMVLGYPEDHLTDWTEITALMGRYGKYSLLREVEICDTTKVDNTTGLRARNYLCQYTLDEVRGVSNGAAAFYVWTSKVVGKHDSKGKKSADNTTKPLTNSGGKGQQPGSQPVTPATQNKPSTTDAGKDKKQTKQQENKAKQQQDAKTKQAQANNKAKDTKQTVDTKQTNASKTTAKKAGDMQQNATNVTTGKTTKKG
ncbi:hypothetical protein ACF0H5_013402 [Mactra antiquata]